MSNEKLNNNLFKLLDLCKPNNDKNIIISGLSIKMALTMLLNGAQGQSAEELISFLGKNKKELNEETSKLLMDCNENLKLANAFWFAEPNKINEDFKQIIKTYQNAEINVDDFQSLNTLNKINNWIDKSTNGLIKHVLEEIKYLTSLLINTLYFKGQWSNPFNDYLTHDNIFKGTDRTSSVKMMKNTTKTYFENNYAKGFNLNYKDSPFEFIAALPNKEGDFKIEELDLNHFNSIDGNYVVNIQFPKLDIEFISELEKVLPLIGINAPFHNSHDFISMLSIPQQVSQIIHKIKFKLDENGTEASAATIITMARGIDIPSNPPIEINLIFDRPFAFIIRHIKTNELLFIGKINNL